MRSEDRSSVRVSNTPLFSHNLEILRVVKGSEKSVKACYITAAFASVNTDMSKKSFRDKIYFSDECLKGDQTVIAFNSDFFRHVKIYLSIKANFLKIQDVKYFTEEPLSKRNERLHVKIIVYISYPEAKKIKTEKN